MRRKFLFATKISNFRFSGEEESCGGSHSIFSYDVRGAILQCASKHILSGVELTDSIFRAKND